jgi:hypothetical protein
MFIIFPLPSHDITNMLLGVYTLHTTQFSSRLTQQTFGLNYQVYWNSS